MQVSGAPLRYTDGYRTSVLWLLVLAFTCNFIDRSLVDEYAHTSDRHIVAGTNRARGQIGKRWIHGPPCLQPVGYMYMRQSSRIGS